MVDRPRRRPLTLTDLPGPVPGADQSCSVPQPAAAPYVPVDQVGTGQGCLPRPSGCDEAAVAAFRLLTSQSRPGSGKVDAFLGAANVGAPIGLTRIDDQREVIRSRLGDGRPKQALGQCELNLLGPMRGVSTH